MGGKVGIFQCPDCFQEVVKVSKYCPGCGKEIGFGQWIPPSIYAGTGTEKVEKIVCSDCGKSPKNKADEFCRFCGGKIKTETSFEKILYK